LRPELTALLKNAHQKNANSPTVNSLTTWLKEQVADATSAHDIPEEECCLVQSFFTASVVQVIQTAAFRSGLRIQATEEPTTILTPWQFIRSIESFETAKSSRIPPGGMSAAQLADIVTNIIFLFHMITEDFRDSARLQYGHSTFSRFSPLAGHLLLLSTQLKHPKMVEAWANKITNARRETLTKAVFVAIAELFSLYEEWMKPRMEPKDAFLQARVGKDLTLTLLTPATNARKERILPSLQRWKKDISIFQPTQITHELPRDGFFATPTPSCFEVKPEESNRAAEHNRGRRDSSNRHRPPEDTPAERSSGHTGESRRRACVKAKIPMMSRGEGAVQNQSVQAIMEAINQGRSEIDKLKFPLCQMVGKPRRPLCFRFCSTEGDGCSTQNCRYIHVDLFERRWVIDNIPEAFMREFLAMLDRPEVVRHMKATPALRRFLGGR
jgi:hypothetical protein